jgi:nitroreductase
MKPVTNETLLTQLRWRYATKMFDPQKRISSEDWRVLEEVLLLTPSSFGLQPWKFIVVTDPAKKAELRPHSWNQPQITDCSHLVVFAIRRNLSATDVQRLIDRTVAIRKVPAAGLETYRQMMLGNLVNGSRSKNVDQWSARQTYIALGNFMTSAAMLGIDTCPLEGFEPPKYDQALGLAARGLSAVVLCAAGYRAADDQYAGMAKVRFGKEDVIEHI